MTVFVSNCYSQIESYKDINGHCLEVIREARGGYQVAPKDDIKDVYYLYKDEVEIMI